jgi:hypothetical protein
MAVKVSEAPAVVGEGKPETTSVLAAAGVTVKRTETAGVRLPSVAVSVAACLVDRESAERGHAARGLS